MTVRSYHWFGLGLLWTGIVVFAALVLNATIVTGHLPSYGNPDPNSIGLLPGLYEAAGFGVILMLFGIPWVFVTSALRSVLAPRGRDRVAAMLLSIAGILIAIVLFQRFTSWYFD